MSEILLIFSLDQDPYVNTPRMPLSGMLPSASTPATPTGTRRAHHQQQQQLLHLNGFGVDVYGNR